MHVLLIDNYDSFTYNLVQLLRESRVVHQLTMITNDTPINDLPDDIDKVLVSPGPGLPEEAANLMQLIAHYIPSHPILGICLGHQAIATSYGARLIQKDTCFHGFSSAVYYHDNQDYLYRGVPEGFSCGRYHSWLVDNESLSDEMEVTATDAAGNIMAIRHKRNDIRGLQFHPESFITRHGQQIIRNWMMH